MSWPSSVPISFARSGATASRFNGAGLLLTGLAADLPRLDFDPSSKAPRGLLIEAAFTNLLTRSEELDHADWTLTNGTVTANEATAPDGAASGDLFTVTGTSASGGYLQQNKTATALARFATSTFFRKRDTGWAAIEILDGASNGRRFWFNINTGVIGSTAAVAAGLVAAGQRIEDCGSGWYRARVAVVMAADTTAKCIFHPAVDADASIAVTATKANRAWGMMGGVGEATGSYVKTTSASATRGADIASIATAKLLRPTGFTLYSEFQVPQIDQATARHAAHLYDGTTANRVRGGWAAGSLLTDEVVAAAVTSYSDNAPVSLAALTTVKHAMRVKANDFRGCWNGTLNDADTSGAVPSGIATLVLGARSATPTEPLNGWLRRVRLFPRPLTDAQLQALTA